MFEREELEEEHRYWGRFLLAIGFDAGIAWALRGMSSYGPTRSESLMRFDRVALLGLLLVASPLAAQDNPFAFTGGSVKSAYIIYDVMNKDKSTAGASYEAGVAGDR